jgi:hypothetical protein
MNDQIINLVTEIKVKYVPKCGRKPIGEIHTSLDAFKILYPLFNPILFDYKNSLLFLILKIKSV